MRVLLIDPPFYRLIGFANRYYPMGLCALGADLETRGHTVAVHDHDANVGAGRLDYANQAHAYREYLARLQDPRHETWQTVVRAARDFRPDVIGISLLTPKIGAGIRVGLALREALPAVPIVVGGTHPTVQPDETLSWGFSDLAVRGEGEETFAELLAALAAGGPVAGIRGLSWRDRDGVVHHEPNRPLLTELDRLPAPGRHLLLNRSRYSGEDLGLIMTSRGCPYNCRFCSSKSVWGRRTRFRSIANVADEVADIIDRFGVSYLTLKDDSFTLRRQHVLDWCRVRDQRFARLPWECVTRLDLIDPELLAQMRRSGCVTVKVGIESGSPRMLQTIDKGEDLATMRRGAGHLRRSGMFWSAYFIMGLPGEEESDLHESLAVLREFRPDFAAIGVYEPFPGTPMFADGIARGLFKPTMTADEVLRTPPGDYYLARPGVHSDRIDPERFAHLERETVASFAQHNRRLRFLLRRGRARLAQYRLDPAMLFSDAGRFVRWYPQVHA